MSSDENWEMMSALIEESQPLSSGVTMKAAALPWARSSGEKLESPSADMSPFCDEYLPICPRKTESIDLLVSVGAPVTVSESDLAIGKFGHLRNIPVTSGPSLWYIELRVVMVAMLNRAGGQPCSRSASERARNQEVAEENQYGSSPPLSGGHMAAATSLRTDEDLS